MGNSDRRVVVTGIGATTPLGNNVKETWSNVIQGKSGVAPITLFDTKDCPVRFAAEIKGFDPTQTFPSFRVPRGNGEFVEISQISSAKDLKKMGRFIPFALASGFEAYLDSGLQDCREKIPAERIGTNIGVGMGGLGEIEAVHDTWRAKGYRRITPFFIPQVIANLASGQLSIALHLKGPNLCNVTACSSSAHSIGESFHLIRRGDADVMLVGGAEAVISQLGIGGFAAMKALSTRNDEPQKASRPFDVQRDGFVMGEGSASLVLEDYETAKKRGAQIYAEIIGYGLSGDGYHMTSPAPEGEGGYRAMEMALQHAGISKEEIGYINAHGTSTPAGDVEECRAIRKLFPSGPEHLQVSSTKSMTGHLLGAAGAVETVFSILAIRDGKIPPTINLEELDPGCKELGLNYTAHHAADRKIKYALSNSFGFGGTNACLIVGKV